VDWTPEWDLSTIPDKLFLSERARRNAAKRTKPTRLNLQPCPKCGKVMNSRQRRYPCPSHIPAPARAVRELANVRRADVFQLVTKAIEKRGQVGPGSWSVSLQGRFGVMLEWSGVGTDVGHDLNSQKPWEQFGGNELVRAAGYSPKLPLQESSYSDEEQEEWHFCKVLPTSD